MSIYQRLVDYYSRSGAQVVGGMWGDILRCEQSELVLALESKSADSLRVALGKKEVLRGLEPYERIPTDKTPGLELLRTLGQRIGITPARDDEKPSPTNNWMTPHLELLSKIELRFGPLSLPECFGRTVHDQDTCYSYLQNLSAAATLGLHCRKFPERILEIGAGLGMFGIAAHRLGTRSYTVVDLPTTGVVSAFYLNQVLGDVVWLYGEPARDSYSRHFPNTMLSGAVGEYDAIVNYNSLPELPYVAQEAYVQFIIRCLDSGGIFHSINQESDNIGQRSVPLAIDGRLRLIYRAPFMMRPGYMEEIYTK